MKTRLYAFSKAISVLIIVVQLLLLFPMFANAQARDCYKVSILEVVNNPSKYGNFSSRQIFVPPWVAGDRDFNGNGPMYSLNVTLWYTALGIYADVDMNAWEVDDENRPQWDHTEAKGSSRLWFYKPPIGWELSRFEIAPLDSPRFGYELKSSTAEDYGLIDISASFSVRNRRDSNGHSYEPETLYADIGVREALGRIEIVGDTDGDDAGVATGIAVAHLNFQDSIQLCRIKAPFYWSSAGPIPGMTCTQVYEPNEPTTTTWNDNYFCSTLPMGMAWSHRGTISGMNCVQWHESREPAETTWNDNYLCFNRSTGPYNFTYAWSSAGPVANMICTQVFESREPSETTWGDNYFCFYPLPPR